MGSGRLRHDVTLADVQQDELLARDGPWADQPIILTSEGRLSLREIHAELRVAPHLEISTLPDAADFLGGQCGTVEQIAAALVRLHIRTAVRVAGFALREYPHEQLVALAGEPEPVLEGEKLFPPLAFVPFLDSEALSGAAARLNRAHPFARWLIDRAPVLSEKYPGILLVLRSHLFGLKGYGWKPNHVCAPVNEALAWLADLDPELAPPRRIFVRPEDFAVKPRIEPR